MCRERSCLVFIYIYICVCVYVLQKSTDDKSTDVKCTEERLARVLHLLVHEYDVCSGAGECECSIR